MVGTLNDTLNSGPKNCLYRREEKEKVRQGGIEPPTN